MPNQIASKYKVVVMGANSGSGASCLAQRLIHHEFSEHYEETIGAEYSSFSINGLSGALWALSGAARFDALRSVYLKSANMVLYCVDLSIPADSRIEKIKQDISDIKQQTPMPHVILVATKSDLYPGNSQKHLDDLSQQVASDECVVTSAKTGEGVDSLRNLIMCKANLHPVQNGQEPLLLDGAIRFMVSSLALKVSLTDEQKTNLFNELTCFKRALTSNATDTHVATERFVTSCHHILEGKHPDIMAAVYTFAAVVVVAGVIALAGIAFGVAILPISITSGIGAVATAGLTLNSIFTERSHINSAIDRWSQAILNQEVTTPAVR